MALLLLLPAGPLPAQVTAGPGVGLKPPVTASSVDGFVTAVDGNLVTLLGSELLTLDLTGATILPADAADATPPPIGPGAHIAALVDDSGAISRQYPPPPLKVIRATVRPAGTALLTGEIQSVGTDSFSLLFRTILVDAGTVFSGAGETGPVKELSDLKPGMQAEAWVRASGETLTAVRVVAFGRIVPPNPIYFRGVVKEIGPDIWRIGDMSVGVTAETRIIGEPGVGDTVDVVAKIVDPPNPMMKMPSRLVAVSIVKVAVPPSPVPGRTLSFTGPVQAMPPSGLLGLWRIADRSVTVTRLTKIEGSPAVGSTVSVTGYALPNAFAPATGGLIPTTIIATEITARP